MFIKIAFVCFVSTLFLFFTNTSAIHNTSFSPTCLTQRCTSGPNISYPFWLSLTDQLCGYHELGLLCSGGVTVFSHIGLYYTVQNIDYENHSLKLLDPDTFNETCPKARHAVPLGNLPLTHSPLNLNLSFYYNCTNYPSGVPSIQCLRSGTNQSFVFVSGNETTGFDWSGNCEEKIVVTVMKDAITSDGDLISQFSSAMDKGFVLEWHTASYCVQCEASGGVCGYSNPEKKVLCFCKDGSTKDTSCYGMLVAKWWNHLNKNTWHYHGSDHFHILSN